MKKLILLFIGVMLSTSVFADSNTRTVELSVVKDSSITDNFKIDAAPGVIIPNNPNPTTTVSLSSKDGDSPSVTNTDQYTEESVSANIYDDTYPATVLKYVDDPGQEKLYPSINATAVIKDTSKSHNADICRINIIHAYNGSDNNYAQVMIHNPSKTSSPYCQFVPAGMSLGYVELCSSSSCSYNIKILSR